MKKMIISFVAILILFCGIVIFPFYNKYNNTNRPTDSMLVVQSLRAGGFKGKSFDKNFHRVLRKGFPDWKERKDYEEKQRKLYMSAKEKLKTVPYTVNKEDKKVLERILSPEERDSIDYFLGQGYYKYFQDVNHRPVIFDTCETFLFKMHDKKARETFLDSVNRRKNEASDSNHSDKT